MSRFEDKWELPLLVVTAGLGMVATMMLLSSVPYIERISASAENNVVYEVMTTSPELARLQATVAERFLPGSSVTDDDVALRFSIIENRMKILATEESRKLRQDSQEASDLIARMQTVVAAAAPKIAHLDDAAEAMDILAMFEPLNRQAARLAALTTSTAATRIAVNEEKLVAIFWWLLADILTLLTCGIIVIVLLRRARRKAQHSAGIDVLTALPNRLAFNTTLAKELARPEPADTLAVLMFDLDFFKDINDTQGHAAGDQLLSLVAARLAPLLSDALLFARLGGDEFAAVYRHADVTTVAELAAQRIQRAFTTPFAVAQKLVMSGASIGIAVAGADDREADELLMNADLALYATKEWRRGGFRTYQPGMKAAYLKRLEMIGDLEVALDADQFELRFQPLVALDTQRTTSFEAMLRWQHPRRGWVQPSDFIDLAEETGLILPIGRWVLDQACAAASGWPEDIGISINLSGRQVVDPGLMSSVLDALTMHGLTPGRLTLEITESALLQNDTSVLSTLHALREVGVKIALDDFGTGYASLSYLTRFPFDLIKVDQSFVRGAADGCSDVIIVEAICDLAAKLGIATMAEGIETEEQLAMVRSAGCRNGQGYLFGKPMTSVQCQARLVLEAGAAPPPLQRRAG